MEEIKGVIMINMKVERVEMEKCLRGQIEREIDTKLIKKGNIVESKKDVKLVKRVSEISTLWRSTQKRIRGRT